MMPEGDFMWMTLRDADLGYYTRLCCSAFAALLLCCSGFFFSGLFFSPFNVALDYEMRGGEYRLDSNC